MQQESDNKMSGDKLLDGVHGIAEHLGIPARSVQHMIDSYGMPVIRMGRRIYGRPATITEWFRDLEARTHVEGQPHD